MMPAEFTSAEQIKTAKGVSRVLELDLAEAAKTAEN